jgi:phage baseplate assembly protein W
MDENNLQFLGKGWAFPVTFDSHDGTVVMVKELEDIRESLFILVSTIPGERLMRPEYGCDLHSLVFENFNKTVQTRAKDMIKHAIMYFEPRVKVEKIEISTDPMESIAFIDIWYFVPKVNSRHNMVYPFYFKEGTNLNLSTDLLR